MRIVDTKRRIAETLPVQLIVPLQDGVAPLALDRATDVDVPVDDLESAPRGPAVYGTLPAAANRARALDGWRKEVAAWLYDTRSLTLLEHVGTGLHSTPGESEGAFLTRVAEATRQQRDAGVDAVRKRYATKLQTQTDRIRRAEQQLGKQQQDVTASTGSALLTAATGVFGALFGRKTFSATNAGRIGTAARGAGRVLKEKQDVTRAEETLKAEQEKLAALQAEIETAIAALSETPAMVQPLVLRPRKTDIALTTTTLVWWTEEPPSSPVIHNP